MKGQVITADRGPVAHLPLAERPVHVGPDGTSAVTAKRCQARLLTTFPVLVLLRISIGRARGRS